MEDELPTGADGADRAEPVDGIPPLPAELTPKEEELRRMVEAGAASPEELRSLAAKLEEKRRYEETLWRREVRPALIKSKKRRVVREKPTEKTVGLGLGVVLLGAVILLLLIATQTSFLWLLIPVVGVLVYAWSQGRKPPDEPAAEPPS